MNIETIDKWLNEEYGCSYTRLEELLEFYTDREMKFKERINKAIEYIESIEDLKLKWTSDSIVDIVGYKTIEDLDNKYHNIEGCFIKINKHYLLDILKGVDKE